MAGMGPRQIPVSELRGICMKALLEHNGFCDINLVVSVGAQSDADRYDVSLSTL